MAQEDESTRIFNYAVEVFKNADSARIWLNEPKKRFGNRTPLDMISTNDGVRAVEEFLCQIDDGMFA